MDEENNSSIGFQEIIKANNLSAKKSDLIEILRLITKVANNHTRTPNFSSKIQEILLFLKDKIISNFSNSEIFQIFKSNKRILLFLFEEKILIPDQSIADSLTTSNFKQKKYIYYFYPELKSFYNDKILKNVNKKINYLLKKGNEFFEEKRKIGENESDLSYIIRNDLIDDFVTLHNQSKLQFSTKINQSIFETNPFLMKNQATLFEYSAFFGSIKIFNYMRINNVKLDSSLWFYAIHGNSPEIIHLLEENHIKPPANSNKKLLRESIKCHNNNITNYIKNSLMKNEVDEDHIYISLVLKNRNFSNFPEDFDLDNFTTKYRVFSINIITFFI